MRLGAYDPKVDVVQRQPVYRGVMSTPARRRWPHIDPRLIDAASAVALFLLLVLSFGGPVHQGQRGVDVGAWILAAGLCVPIFIHRRFPLGAVAVTLASLVGFALLRYAPYLGISVAALWICHDWGSPLGGPVPRRPPDRHPSMRLMSSIAPVISAASGTGCTPVHWCSRVCLQVGLIGGRRHLECSGSRVDVGL
jgi:hypothetical protein